MAFNTNRQLVLDIKAQDRLREWFSQRGSTNNVILKAVSLGDSDVDYKLSDQSTKIEVLSAPYNISRIKHKLIYDGVASNLTGHLAAYMRHVNVNGDVESLYAFPPDNSTFTQDIIPPVLTNGYDTAQLIFGSATTDKEGFIVFLQTVPDGFPDPLDTTGKTPLRFIEKYDYKIDNLPAAVAITNVSNGNPIVITTGTPHGLVTGSEVVLQNISGNTTALGTFFINVLTGTTFEIYTDSALTIPVDGTASGIYSGGGSVLTWSVTVDDLNGSFLICKTKRNFIGNTDGKITITGKLTGIVKQISFNY